MTTEPTPFQYPEGPLSRACLQKLMLGVFLPLQSGGWSLSTLPASTSWSFPYNLEVTRFAEELGFEWAFGASEWLSKGGFGGKTHYHDISLDPFIAADALSAVTQRIILLSTIHILYGWHPLMVAKFGATLDHISQGRWGVNIVTGHRAREHRRFGLRPIGHDERYERASEFIDMTKALWQADCDVTRAGRHWQMEDAYVGLKRKYGRPLIVSATGSAAGIEFASHHCDIVFTGSVSGAHLKPLWGACQITSRR